MQRQYNMKAMQLDKVQHNICTSVSVFKVKLVLKAYFILLYGYWLL